MTLRLVKAVKQAFDDRDPTPIDKALAFVPEGGWHPDVMATVETVREGLCLLVEYESEFGPDNY